jgi:hypothetical protein
MDVKKISFLRGFMGLLFFVLMSYQAKAQTLDSTSKVISAAPVAKHGFLYDTDLFAFTDLRYGVTLIGQNLGVGLNFKYRFNLFKLGYSYNFKSPYTKQNDISLMYGWSFRKNNLLFSVAGGVSKSWGVAATNERGIDSISLPIDPQVKVNNFGVPLEMIISFTPPPNLKVFSSIGLSLFCNFNGEKNYFGGGLNLGLCKVSPKVPKNKKDDPYKGYYQPKQRVPAQDRP